MSLLKSSRNDPDAIVSAAEQDAKSSAKDHLKTALENIKSSAMELGWNSHMSDSRFVDTGLAYRCLMAFSKSGRYPDLHIGDPYVISLVEAYLESIDKRSYGFGSILANENAFDNLIRKNGPKKMKFRLAGYIKRKMARMVK